MEAKGFGLVVLVLVGVAAVSCGDRSDELAGGRSEESTPDTVVVEGSVFTDFHVDLTCEEYSTNQEALPEELSGIALTFSDQGEVFGQTSTGGLQWSELDSGCRFYTSYRASLPKSAGYRVDFDPPPPTDSGFYGAEELTTQEISFEDLEDDGFRWDFEAPPTYEVGDPPCAFDDTGCLAADLVITAATDDEGLTASIAATAGIEANSWTQEGTTADRELDGATTSLGDPADFPAVAPRFDLSVGWDSEGVKILVLDVGEQGSGEPEAVQTLQLKTGQIVQMTLPAGTYVLSVSVPSSASHEFRFGIRIP